MGGNIDTTVYEELVLDRNQLQKQNRKVVSNRTASCFVEVDLTRNGDFTIAIAHAELPWGRGNNVKEYTATGATVKSDRDKEDISIGDSLAVSRALKKLASLVCADTMDEVHERSAPMNERPFAGLNNEEIHEAIESLNYEIDVRLEKEAIAEARAAEGRKLAKKSKKEGK